MSRGDSDELEVWLRNKPIGVASQFTEA